MKTLQIYASHLKAIRYICFLYILSLGYVSIAHAQTDTVTYHLTIRKEMVDKAGKQVMGMTLNGGIPGPTLTFKEGGYAVIYVKNEMDVETSIHWHGLLLPNFYDGVPYLTTPPIEPGHTQKYEFPLRQSGTYWYHSHTMLQEQSGVYGSIVIQPKEKSLHSTLFKGRDRVVQHKKRHGNPAQSSNSKRGAESPIEFLETTDGRS